MSTSLTSFRKTAQIPKPLYLSWNKLQKLNSSHSQNRFQIKIKFLLQFLLLKSGGTHTRLSLVIFYLYYFFNFRDRLVFLLVFFFKKSSNISQTSSRQQIALRRKKGTPWKVCWIVAVAVSRFQRFSWGIFREEWIIGPYEWKTKAKWRKKYVV